MAGIRGRTCGRGRVPTGFILAGGVFLAGCAPSGAGSADVRYGAPVSEAAVRAFLDGANVDDYQRMSALFGTRDGPAVDAFGVAEVEQRMIFLAKLLKHASYELRQANLAQLGPDRVRYVALMTGTRKGDVSVPIVVVPSRGGRWFVEQLDLDALAGSTVP